MNTQKKLHSLYDCKINVIGHQVINKASLLYGPSEIDPIEYEKIISIEMPESDFNHFCNDYEQYLSIIQATRTNLMAKDLYDKLLTFSHLVK